MSATPANEFNGAQLRLARHYWGTTLQELADVLDMTRQFVSKLETGKSKPDILDPVVVSLAENLRVQPRFFFKPSARQITEEQAHFRKLATTKASTRQTVLARGSVFDEVVEYLDKRVRLPIVDFPDHAGADSSEAIERAAEQVRSHWSLGLGPIAHMVRVVERAGAVVAFFHEASAEVDALSITSRRPVIVRNDAKRSPFRQRFDIAHELGHLVLHEGHITGDRKTENEANRFASAFLLPRSTFIKAFSMRGSRLDWAGIRDLKLTFQVSKAAILYRAKVLDLIDEDQFRSAFITLKNRGEGIEEAEDTFAQKEEGEILAQALKILREAHGIGPAKLARDLDVQPEFLRRILPLGDDEPVRQKPSLRLVR